MSYKLDHVGHVVRNLEEGMKLYERLGLAQSRSLQIPEFGARMVFYPYAGVDIELIEPGGLKGDPAARCLKERGEGLFHLSISVDDLDAEIQALRNKGFTVEEYTHVLPETEHPVRLAFLAPEETKGLWIEFMQVRAEPSSG